jgi:2'-5' RNA ligase
MRDLELTVHPQWYDSRGRYEVALVYAVPPDLGAWIFSYRISRVGIVQAREQIEPHLTLCYFGRMDGTGLHDLMASLMKLDWPDLLVEIRGVGTFHRNSRVSNVHLVLNPYPDLTALHYRALSCGKTFQWFEPDPYTGSAYFPHISIIDGVDIGVEEFQAPEGAPPPGSSIQLARPHLLGKRLDPVEVMALHTRSVAVASSPGNRLHQA